MTSAVRVKPVQYVRIQVLNQLVGLLTEVEMQSLWRHVYNPPVSHRAGTRMKQIAKEARDAGYTLFSFNGYLHAVDTDPKNKDEVKTIDLLISVEDFE